jgi:hypothetical protein
VEDIMPSNLWMAALLSLAVVAVIVLAFRFAPFGRPFRHAQDVHVMCPRLQRLCDCRVEQEVYSGRWERVLACSAFPDHDLPCDQSCVQRLNLGLHVPPTA